MLTRLRPFDLGVVACYLVAITLFGLRFSRGRRAAGEGSADRTLRGYFLANRSAPWWAIALSIVSAETSTLTIIGTPGLAFAGNLGFLQIVLGYMLGRVVVAALFLPRYFQGEMLTAYQLIDRRFGHALHKVTAGLFLLVRAAAEGVRVFAVSIVVGIAIGTGDVLSIGIISLLTLVYTFEGGMAAVIWTDVVQMAIYVGGTAMALWSLGGHVPGGWTAIHAAGAAAGKFRVFDFAWGLSRSYTFWAGVLGGTALTMASHGTDQLMVQRMLAAKNLRESRFALLSSGVVIFVQFWMFLLIGVGLWVFYGQHPGAFAGAGAGNRIFPVFIVREMPVGVAGLLVAAILAAAMSNLSAALNSLSSTTVVDFYMGWRPQAAADTPAAERERMLVSRGSTVLWAVVLFAVAVYTVAAGGRGNVVELGLSIASVAYGCLLGVFLLGTLTRYATQAGAIAGMVCGFAVNLLLWLESIRSVPQVVFGVRVPVVAFTWYVLIGAAVTFGVGMLGSLVGRGARRRAVVGVAALVVLLVGFAGRGWGQAVAVVDSGYDFSGVSAAVEAGIAAKKLPGAVVVVGHGGKVVFERAYGVRKEAGEPGVGGKPSAAEPMTEDTIFDMASLTKCLATATAVMQLAEQGKVDVDAPVVTYLPEFGANGKAAVTVRELLTHYSGLPPDVDLKDAWGLAAPDKAEGLRRAMGSKLDSVPGTRFVYSDINYIVLGAIVERVSGETLDGYAERHVFERLGMTSTRFLPWSTVCGATTRVGAALVPSGEGLPRSCPQGSWPGTLIAGIAPTQHDDQGTAETNPDFDRLLRGTVHDPTTRRMGGVAGQAGVFSTAHDVSVFAQALLDRLAGRPSAFPLKRETLARMSLPEQPGTAEGGATVFAPDGKPTTGVAQRGFGWDINSAFSRPRGAVFPTVMSAAEARTVQPSFGHTGFTGTSLWMDPASDTYVVLLANSVHPRGRAALSPLRGEVATAAATALGLVPPGSHEQPGAASAGASVPAVLTGIDVLEASGFDTLKRSAAGHGGKLRVGILTNQTGMDAAGRRTVDVIRGAGSGIDVVRLFSPEHGLFGAKDREHIGQENDAASGIVVTGLYGPRDSDKRPKASDLADLDAVVIDLQDAGVRFYTYETVLGYFLEAEACERARGHPLEVIVLDRPAMIGGLAVQGPVSNMAWSYTNYMPMPVRNGMTIGELAEFIQGERAKNCGAAESSHGGLTPPCHCPADPRTGVPTAPVAGPGVTVVQMRGWRREQLFDQTGVRWVNPSPNLRSAAEAVLYPGVGMLDATNVSVGRGTAMPFEVFGAPWMDGATVAAYLRSRRIPGVEFTATSYAVQETPERYPGHGQTIGGVRMRVTDHRVLDSPELGVEIISALHRLYPGQFTLPRVAGLVANSDVLAGLERGDDPREIANRWTGELKSFTALREQYLLYR
ncbi:MAG: sodium/solute symporter [Acidobacteriota bacterium]|nr:sodium/solute symporter [Acidobacteriota bacterium]